MRAIAPLVLRELIELKVLDPSVQNADCATNCLPWVTNREFAQHRTDAVLTVGLPAPLNWSGENFDNHLCWWPHGLPDERLVGVVSSRLDRQLENWQAWFRGLRSVCADLNSTAERLLCATESSTGRFALRAAQLFGQPTLSIDTAPRKSLKRWWKSITGRVNSDSDRPHDRWQPMELFVSPAIVDERENLAALRDRLMFALSEKLTALHVADSSSTYQLLMNRLAAGRNQPGSSRVLLGERTVSDTTRDALLQQGCVGWYVTATSSTEGQDVPQSGSRNRAGAIRPPRRLAVEDLLPGEWLTHCTRRRVGPWPQQPESQYLDELIFEEPSADRSAIAALTRIVQQRRLMASSDGVRGKAAVVCFTRVPLVELHKLNVFRPHRGRWDFQPYGLCISRGWLQQAGGRAVRYASTEQWKSLAKEARPFFQVERSITKSGTDIDWTVEEEWRVVGDVDLSKITHNQIVLFVPTVEDANRLRAITNWQICVADF